MKKVSLKQLTRIALMVAIVFVCTYSFKLPIAITGGYMHLGDCAVFIGVMILGKKHGAIAGALGAALSDLLGGFALWVLPTFFFKGIMAWIMGSVIEKHSTKKYSWLAGACLGGLAQVICYQLFKLVVLGPAAALATIPTVSMQTICGIVIAAIIITILQNSRILNRLQQI